MPIIIKSSGIVGVDGKVTPFHPSMLNERVLINDEDFVTLRSIMRLLKPSAGYLEIWQGEGGVIDCIDYCANMLPEDTTDSKDYIILHKDKGSTLSLRGGVITDTHIEDCDISSVADVIDSTIIVTVVSSPFTLAELLTVLFDTFLSLTGKEIS